MEYPDEEMTKYRSEFQKRQSRRKIIMVVTLVFLLVIGFVVIPLMSSLGIQKWLWAPFVYLFMACIIIAILFTWRCPVCNGLLGDIFNTKFCSKCGFKFDEKNEFSE
jgi:uncharacterized membrane protein